MDSFLALCYHYLRTGNEEYKRILGTFLDEFHRHIQRMAVNYRVIDLDTVQRYFYSNDLLPSAEKSIGLLFTFDDGLSDHYCAAEILAEYGYRGVFFIPTCILQDRQPANPTIIHYCLAIKGIDGFLVSYRHALETFGLDMLQYDLRFVRGESNPWQVIAEIKELFKYRFDGRLARQILLFIYRELLEPLQSDFFSVMHLTEKQIREMINMGHSIGTHSHTHISVAASTSGDAERLETELIKPRQYLEQVFDTPVYSMSYPFGAEKDCLSGCKLLEKTREYQLAFSVEEKLNRRNSSPLEIGRYMPTSRDSADYLVNKLEGIKTRGQSGI